MRLTQRLSSVAALLAAAALALATASAQTPPPAAPKAPAPAGAAEPPKDPNDVLGNIVVVAGASRPLPKIAVLPSLSSDIEDVTLRNVMQRDLDLCGEFEMLPDSATPQGLYLSDSPVDVKAWASKGVEAVVKVTGKKAAAPGQAELRAQAFFVKRGDAPVFDKGFVVPAPSVRVESHRIADLVIGALTGQSGGFASHMAFVSGTGDLRRVYVIDADGHDARAASPDGYVSLAPTFGKNAELYYSASVKNDVYRLFGPDNKPVALPVEGSVYGVAFSRDKSQVAVSIGVGSTLKVFLGPDFASIKPASTVGMALRPTFTPSGKLAFAGEGKYGQRIYVGDKPITPEGIFASSPVFCNNPDGARAVFAVGVGLDSDLVSTGESGGGLSRLTQGQGRNTYPACSPDGRLVAFFSTRKSGEGPGLYIMRLDGGRPKRISTLLGDSLRWEALPPGKVSGGS
jgi:TolB protein